MTNATSSTPSGQPLGISHKPSPTETMFDEFKAADKPAFIGYLPYGFPDPDYSLKAFRTMVEHGVNAVEIGLPYSDPVMDGPVIQAASQIAIDNGEKIANVFKAVKQWRTPGEVPLVRAIGTSLPYGVERFARDFENAGEPGSHHPGSLRTRPASGSKPPTVTDSTASSWYLRIPPKTVESRCGQCAGFRLCCRPHGRHRRTLHHRCVPEGTGCPYPQGRCEKRVRRHRRVHRGTGGSCRIVCGRCHRRLGSGAYHA